MSSADSGTPSDGGVLEHVTLTVTDLAAALDFYDAALGALGLVRLDELRDEEEDDAAVEAVAWGPPDGRSVLWVVAGPAPTAGVHLSLHTDSQAQVETFVRAAVAHGGELHSAPRRWTLYRRGRFGAMVADPSGNLVEATADEA